MNNREEGMEGEKMAFGYLQNIGYEILESNFRTRYGEIDLIGFDKKANAIVFVEVKTRKSRSFGLPEEAVDERKIKKMIRTANIWLDKKNKLDSLWRIDIISIELDSKNQPKIKHLQNITQEMDYMSDNKNI